MIPLACELVARDAVKVHSINGAKNIAANQTGARVGGFRGHTKRAEYPLPVYISASHV